MNKKEEWLIRYKKRMIHRGINESVAEDAMKVERDTNPDFLFEDPEDAADEEISYWASDG